MEIRKLYLDLGYSSLFTLCTVGLGYSGGAAYRRIQAARCLEKNPEILDKIRSGALSLCAVSELARVETDKRSDLIVASEGKTKKEVQEIVAQVIPPYSSPRAKPKVESVKVHAVVVPPLFEEKREAEEAPAVERRYSVTLELSEAEYRLLNEVQAFVGEHSRTRAVVRTLRLARRVWSPAERAKRREVRLTKKVAAEETVKNEAKKEVQKDAEKTSKQNIGSEITSTVKVEVKAPPPPTVTRHIPAELRDQVTLKDGCRCTFVGSDGHRCTETRGLQLDHLKPYSIGGEHTEENLRVLCGAHNRHVYERFAGRE